MILRGRRAAIHAPISVVPYTKMHEGATTDKVWQEFFCRTSRAEDVEANKKVDRYGRSRVEQPGCGGYFIVGLSAKFTGKVNMKCPKCGHVHTRFVDKGYIQDTGRGNQDDPDAVNVHLMMSAWSQEPRTAVMKDEAEANREKPNRWKAVVIKSEDDLVAEARPSHPDTQIGKQLLRESWLSKLFGSERESKES